MQEQYRELRAAAEGEGSRWNRTEGFKVAFGRFAQWHHAQGMQGAAVALYRSLELAEPQQAKWPYLLGTVLSTNDPDAALVALETALDLKPMHLPSLVRRGELLLLAGDPEAARSSFLPAVDIDSSCARCLFGLARAEIALADPLAAVDALEAARRLAPRHQVLMHVLATTYRQVGRTARAQALFDLSTSATSLEGLPPMADSWIEELAEFRAGSVDRLRRGRQAFARRDYEEALRLFQAAELRSPDALQPRLMAARTEAALGRRELAIEILQQLRAVFPNDHEIPIALGTQHFHRGAVEEAAEQFHSALSLVPTSSAAAWGLARTALAAGDPGRAQAILEPFVRSDGAEPGMLATLIEAMVLNDQRAEALSLLLEANTQDDRRLALLEAWLLATVDSDQEALLRRRRAAFEESKSLFDQRPTLDAAEVLAYTGYYLGRPNEAIAALRTISQELTLDASIADRLRKSMEALDAGRPSEIDRLLPRAAQSIFVEPGWMVNLRRD